MWFFGKWITVLDTTVHQYQQHSKTGKRRILRVNNYVGYQPCNTDWINTGKFTIPIPPSVGSGVQPNKSYGD